MDINPRLPKDTEFINIKFNQSITINQFINNTLQYMGSEKFFSNSSYDNNCQDFALSLLYANGADNDGLISFIKQDTEYIFKNNPYLRRFTNNITDVQGRVTTLKGGKIKTN